MCLFQGFCEVATFRPQSQEARKSAGGGAKGFTSNLRNSCFKCWQRPILRGKWGVPGEALRIPTYPRGRVGLMLSPGSPPSVHLGP